MFTRHLNDHTAYLMLWKLKILRIHHIFCFLEESRPPEKRFYIPVLLIHTFSLTNKPRFNFLNRRMSMHGISNIKQTVCIGDPSPRQTFKPSMPATSPNDALFAAFIRPIFESVMLKDQFPVVSFPKCVIRRPGILYHNTRTSFFPVHHVSFSSTWKKSFVVIS